jgi:hypothetical protein
LERENLENEMAEIRESNSKLKSDLEEARKNIKLLKTVKLLIENYQK